jgi:hypothetical protein
VGGVDELADTLATLPASDSHRPPVHPRKPPLPLEARKTVSSLISKDRVRIAKASRAGGKLENLKKTSSSGASTLSDDYFQRIRKRVGEETSQAIMCLSVPNSPQD